MDKEITELQDQLGALECNLFAHVEALDNHMNECDCCGPNKYDFSNTIEQNEIHIFCLGCGGFITPNEMEM